MKHITSFVLLTLLLASVQSCKMDTCFTKSYFISSYQGFMKDLNANYRSYSKKDWESKDGKMQNFVDDCYANYDSKMTTQEKVDFWQAYLTYMIKRHGSSALLKIKEADKTSVVNIFDELENTLKDIDMKKLLKDNFGNNIEDAVDDVLKEINNWGDQIKDWLKR